MSLEEEDDYVNPLTCRCGAEFNAINEYGVKVMMKGLLHWVELGFIGFHLNFVVGMGEQLRKEKEL